MDPVTVTSIASAALSVAAGAWKVGTGLVEFIGDARNIENTAEGFANEVNALGTACGVVGNRLKAIVIEHDVQSQGPVVFRAESGQLWNCLESQLTACEATIAHLEKAVSFIGKSPKRGGLTILNQFTSQIKIQMNTNSIAEARNRIRSHTTSLQLVLQAVAIEVSYLAPRKADQQLQTQLTELNAKIRQLENLRAERDRQPEPVQYKTEVLILEISSKVRASGNTLYATTTGHESSSIATEVPIKSRYVQDWIDQTNALDDLASEFSETDTVMTPTSSQLQAKQRQDHTHHNPFFNSTTPLADSDDRFFETQEDQDSEDEFSVELTQEAITAGRTLFEKEDYVEADSTLQEALKLIRELPIKHQVNYDPCDLRYMLGICAFHIYEPADAETALLSTVDNAPRAKIQDDARRVQFLNASYHLAITYLKLGKLDQARIQCDSSLKGRRRLLGKTSFAYYESLALKSKVLEVSQNLPRARITAALIPEEQRETLVAKFQQLKLEKPVSNNTVESSDQALLPPLETYVDPTIRSIAEDMQYRRPGPANSITRNNWKNVLDINDQDPVCAALLENRHQYALEYVKNIPRDLVQNNQPVVIPPLYLPGLCVAALFGDEDIVRAFIQAGIGGNIHQIFLKSSGPATEQWHLGPLHCAALGGYYEICLLLITAGSSLRSGTIFPLHLAVWGQRLDVIDLLLAKGDTFTNYGYSGDSIWHLACATNNVLLVAMVFSSIGRNPINAVKAPKGYEKFHAMITSPQNPKPVGEPRPPGETQPKEWNFFLSQAEPLALAAWMDCEKVVQYLISTKQVDVKKRATVLWVRPSDNTQIKNDSVDVRSLALLRSANKVIQMLDSLRILNNTQQAETGWQRHVQGKGWSSFEAKPPFTR